MRIQLLVIFGAMLSLWLAGCSVAVPLQAELRTPFVESTVLSSTTPPESASVPTAVQIEPNALPTMTAQPTQTQMPTPAPVPILRQLTDGGCCVQPSWSPDGQRLLYIDRPSPEAPSGLWSVGLEGGAAQFYSDILGIYSTDLQMRAFLQGGQTVVENIPTGERWVIPSGGRAVSFSPDGMWLAWTGGDAGPPFDGAQREIWISHIDGSQARSVAKVTGGGFGGWFPNGRLLVSGRLDAPEGGQIYWAVTLDENKTEAQQRVELGRGNRLRDAAISPDGKYVAYVATFSEDPSQDGLWIVDSFSGEKRRLDLFGAYQWRDEGRLLVIPLELAEPLHRIMQVEASSGQIQAITDPTVTAFKVANGDWSVSPDGRQIVFVSAADRNIWLLSLPDGL